MSRERSQRAITLDRKLARVRLNDKGNAERLIARHGDDLWFVPGLGWHVWDKKRWCRENGYHAAVARACAMADDIRHEARALLDDEIAEDLITARIEDGLSPDRKQASKDHADFVKKLAGWCSASGNAAKIEAALKLAEHRRLKDQAAFDQRADAVPVMNGTLRFGESAQPDPEMRAFLQRLVGYALIGKNREQVFIWHKGAPAAGKSTFLAVLRALFADFAEAISFDLLSRQSRRDPENATPTLARLPGRRLVLATEPETGIRISEGLIKSLTGGEPISARGLHKDKIEFICTALFMTPMNNPPYVSDDGGIWRRILLAVCRV